MAEMKALHRHPFMQPAAHLLKHITFPVYFLVYRKKSEEFYTILTATAEYWKDMEDFVAVP